MHDTSRETDTRTVAAAAFAAAVRALRVTPIRDQ
jgi:hypothetical protein